MLAERGDTSRKSSAFRFKHPHPPDSFNRDDGAGVGCQKSDARFHLLPPYYTRTAAVAACFEVFYLWKGLLAGAEIHAQI
jgi:hypothetical protein